MRVKYRWWIKNGVVPLGLIYLGVVVALMLLETAMIYPAPPRADGDWQADWLAHEDAVFASADGTQLHGWFCEHPNPRATILFFHGNGEHVAYLGEEMDFLRERYQASVMVFDYRGYGKSQGKPFEAGLLADGEAAAKWLAQRTGQPISNLVLFGRSIGGAVAVHGAATHGARGLVLDRTFNSMVEVAARHMPWVPIRWLLRNRYPSDARIQRYRGPLLQVHGRPDEIIPLELGQALFDAAVSRQKQFIVSDVMTHNAPWPSEYYNLLHEFIDSLP